MPKLSRRAVQALLTGRYAALGGRTLCQRGRNLLTIASRYSREELLAERGVGLKTAQEIRLWVETQLQSQQPEA